ncbi:T9SS type A sorting domain-containing protein [Flavobacterium zepuense]|uniref:T9SS type A sorting domain-containing protein n=1 Tax=Flavobacterium zepuense TaxID=2593302 RepID=A0A552UZA5_9FLAO|nr:GEVED domain-containing protein [Flavobacterium zepuense]TRW23556.1 T9SS type A sorting domain-containing protein [Flavobacterium zepuense]
MNLKLRLLTGFMFLSLFFTQLSYSQLSYSEDFEGDEVFWTNPEDAYWLDDYESCDGYSIVTELYTYYEEGTSVSSTLGISNGQLATLSYEYKLIDYYDDTPYPNSPNWGNFSVEYSTSATGPWTLIETVSPANHIVSGDCATRTVAFTPPAGSNVYLRLRSAANPDEDIDIDALLYFDNVSVTQAASLPCEGTPSASTTIAANGTICNSQQAQLSLSPAYYSGGLTFQWQSSTNGTDYTPITGATSPTYSAAQTASTWYRAVITCTGSGQTATSTPVQVINSGLECYCDVPFEEDIEPITLVNFAGIDNVSSAAINGSPGVENFTGLTPGQVTAGQTYEITLEGNTNDPDGDGYETYFTVFIDWNHDGDFEDDDEQNEIGYLVDSNGTDGVQLTGDIEVPEDALPGLTYMRVFKLFYEFTSDPCSSEDGAGYGQVEDYLINVTTDCNLEAPEIEEDITLCNAATGADLPNFDGDIVWYYSATGDDVVVESDALVAGTYYAAAIEGTCESEERTPVEVIIDVVNLDEVEDVFSCTTYVLPALTNGAYYGGTEGTGTEYEAGDEITETTTLYVYAESEIVEGCFAEAVFTVNIDALPEIEGAEEQTITTPGATITDIVILTVNGASVTWYPTQEDAEAGTNAIPTTTELVNGATYYAVQNNGECSSEVFEVTITTTLGTDDFTNKGFTYYPNPVNSVLTINYSSAITNVTVYNLMRQQVLSRDNTQLQAVTDMSALSTGTYLVKVTAGTQTATLKIVKQ